MLRVFNNPKDAKANGWCEPDVEQGLAHFGGIEWVFVTDVFCESIARIANGVLTSKFSADVDMVFVADIDNDLSALWVAADTAPGIVSCLGGITAGIEIMLALVHPLGGLRHASGDLWEELVWYNES